MVKEIVCTCHDISRDDIVRAIRQGYNLTETLKRFTGVFMGPCQGKMCALNVLRIFAEETGTPIEKLRVPTMRPPVEPVLMGWLAAEDE